MKNNLIFVLLTSRFLLADPGDLKDVIHPEIPANEKFLRIITDRGLDKEFEEVGKDKPFEERGWLFIEKMARSDEAPTPPFVLGDLIRELSLNPGSSELSLIKARKMISWLALKKIADMSIDPQFKRAAAFQKANPFGVDPGVEVPQNYAKTRNRMKFLADLLEGAVNIVAVRGTQKDLGLLNILTELEDGDLFSAYSTIGKDGKMVLKKRLERNP